MRSKIIASTIAALILLGASAASRGEPFFCSAGKQPACLDDGAVVCKSFATCVAHDAICFNAHTCDSNGLVCKSKFDAVVDEVHEKVRKYNELVDEFNSLKSSFEELQRTNRNLNDCLASSDSLYDAQSCAG